MAARALVAVVAILAAFQGSSAERKPAVDILPQAFSEATAPLPPLEYSLYFSISNATASKLQLQNVFQALLKDMGMTVDMMATRTLTALYQKESNYFKFFERYALHPEYLTPTTYDAALPYLGALYRQMVALVKDGASATSKAAPKLMRRLPKQEYQDWAPEDVYVNLVDNVDNGISELKAWVNDFLDAGLSAANSEVAAIMKQKREQELIPHVKTSQDDARRASEKYEEMFQQHSSPEVYEDFVAARQELLDLELVV